MVEILHALSTLYEHNSQGIRYLGSCRLFSSNRLQVAVTWLWAAAACFGVGCFSSSELTP